jgi:hypothetical protein
VVYGASHRAGQLENPGPRGHMPTTLSSMYPVIFHISHSSRDLTIATHSSELKQSKEKHKMKTLNTQHWMHASRRLAFASLRDHLA